jgi:uncharacterized membrane protein YkvA (DUF1232 family)
MKNFSEEFDSHSNRSNGFFANGKAKKRRRVSKKYPPINQVSSASFGTSSNISKSNAILLILIGYIVFGYLLVQLLK